MNDHAGLLGQAQAVYDNLPKMVADGNTVTFPEAEHAPIQGKAGPWVAFAGNAGAAQALGQVHDILGRLIAVIRPEVSP